MSQYEDKIVDAFVNILAGGGDSDSSSGGSFTGLETEDTATLTLIGNGTVPAPLRGIVNISPKAGNKLTVISTDNEKGLYVESADVKLSSRTGNNIKRITAQEAIDQGNTSLEGIYVDPLWLSAHSPNNSVSTLIDSFDPTKTLIDVKLNSLDPENVLKYTSEGIKVGISPLSNNTLQVIDEGLYVPPNAVQISNKENNAIVNLTSPNEGIYTDGKLMIQDLPAGTNYNTVIETGIYKSVGYPVTEYFNYNAPFYSSTPVIFSVQNNGDTITQTVFSKISMQNSNMGITQRTRLTNNTWEYWDNILPLKNLNTRYVRTGEFVSGGSEGWDAAVDSTGSSIRGYRNESGTTKPYPGSIPTTKDGVVLYMSTAYRTNTVGSFNGVALAADRDGRIFTCVDNNQLTTGKTWDWNEIGSQEQKIITSNGVIDLGQGSSMFSVPSTVSTFSFTNERPATKAMPFTVLIKGKPATDPTWPASVKWNNDTLPVYGNNKTTIILLWDGEEYLATQGPSY